MNITIKDLLDAGVHFGHQVRRWNPKSKPYVYDNRHGISIIDLEQTYDLLEKAANAVEEVVSQGKQILLVGTKRQAQEPVRELAAATNMPFCVNRWMGGTLTNYETVSTSLAKYKKFLRMEDDGSLDKLPGKESAAIRRQMSRMHRNFEGLLNLQGLPSALFVIDSHNEAIAIAEANRLKIPVIALVDSNSDPSLLSHPIPGNDDSTKSIRIIVDVILDAIQSGASRRVEAPTRRKDITPVALEPDFIDQEDEPEVTLPEGYDENDFDERRKIPEEVSKIESKEVSTDEATKEEKPTQSENQESSESQEEDAPAEDAPAEDAPAEDAPTEDAPAEETAKS
jgi:small subunit ribosomal protein S2